MKLLYHLFLWFLFHISKRSSPAPITCDLSPSTFFEKTILKLLPRIKETTEEVRISGVWKKEEKVRISCSDDAFFP
jgi:hypothetical protein